MTIINAFSNNQLVAVFQTTGSALILDILLNRFTELLALRAQRTYNRTLHKQSDDVFYDLLRERFIQAVRAFKIDSGVPFDRYVKLVLYSLERKLTYYPVAA